MPTWKLYSVATNDFQWKISDEDSQIGFVEEPSLALAPQQLQSISDFLRQGSSRLAGNSNTNSENFPVFRTGSGKPVAVKQSSISRALSILRDEDNSVFDTGQTDGRENGFGYQDSLFQKGSVKTLEARQSTFPASFKQQFSPNSMFQTGSGKAVNISSAGLNRAKALLGLEENGDHETFHSEKKNGSSDEIFGFRSSFPSVAVRGIANTGPTNASVASLFPPDVKFNSSICETEELVADFLHCADKPPPIKFHTAGGRFISVSSEALKRARSLLGDPELGCLVDEKDGVDPLFSFSKDQNPIDQSSDRELNSNTPVSLLSAAKNSGSSSLFTSPLRSTLHRKKSSVNNENLAPGSNLLKEFDAVAKESTSRLGDSIPQHREHINKNSATLGNRENNIPSKPKLLERPSRGPLVDISNSIGTGFAGRNQNFGEKRKLVRGSFVSPFKKPRFAKPVSPLKGNNSGAPNGLSNFPPKLPSQVGKVSARYPINMARLYMKEYFGKPPSFQSKLENLPDEVRTINPHTAESYVFNDKSGSGCNGVESFWEMLSQSGAHLQYVSKEWVTNHYKWIVWKLASYERCYSTKFSGKLLTVSNVLEELKYRYEREVNYGHRSAIRRILEGDVPPSFMMVLCISNIHSTCDSPVGPQSSLSNTSEIGTCAKVELTDGWYSITAVLDVLLSKKLAAGKLFVGQKLRIWGAAFCGWTGPVSPLEASGSTSLLLHMNGTYRAHWASRLGFCKGGGIPLSFMSIKNGGGAVPITMVGISRIYPVLYRERLSNGGFVVRSERMEAKEVQSFDERRCRVVEGIISESQKANRDAYVGSDNEGEEGAKILKILERAAEPELLMAEMTSEQLNSFTSYQAKLEALRQSDMQKSLEKALQAAGLAERDVTPFTRVRVIGLTSRTTPLKCCPQEGLITIWNPTQKQQSELAEGQAYAVTGLTPISSDSSTLYLQAKGSTAKWLPLSPSALEHFGHFFCPRQSIPLCKLVEVHMSREFDIAAVVVFVGQLFTAAHQKKQWVFVADGSAATLDSNDESETLMAISFSSPCIETDAFAPINSNLVGSTVCFLNLIKRARDNINNLWVAEATENSTYYVNYDHSGCSHLKEAGASAERWAKLSDSTIEQLRGKVLSIISNCKT